MTSYTPSISVIVAAYNQEKYIGRCIRSLLHQSLLHNDYEIIVVDDGSTDLTSYALTQFIDPKESTVKVITLKSNRGLPSALNTGIKASSSQYIVRVDSDDFVNSNFLNFLQYFLENNNHYDAVACDYLLMDDQEKRIRRCSCIDEPIACGIMFYRQHLLDIGLYDENFLCHEETDLRIRFEKKHKIARLEIPLYRYRMHEHNITSDTDLMNNYKLKLLQKHKDAN